MAMLQTEGKVGGQAPGCVGRAQTSPAHWKRLSSGDFQAAEAGTGWASFAPAALDHVQRCCRGCATTWSAINLEE